ncbi:hypothetical protein [Methylobacter sp.]|uniref:hypothetical protein n=1 Tax=Methylobacter sp. TaxID=2051955 RepID=UPI00121F89B7|nr:hypothetical protein [Methylobacter sp.]TAK59484.1 MAG: hypothetical protein EPO18_20185 [Methylobacter sp.]
MEATPSNTYLLPSENLEKLKSKLEQLSKKATKVGAPLPRFELHSEHVMNLGAGLVEYALVMLEGEAPKFSGWTFAARVDFLDKECTFALVPGTTLPVEQRTQTQRCDHCRVKRDRTEHYLVRHDSGEYKMVGSGCIKDFLGHADPRAIASYMQSLFALEKKVGQYNGGAGQLEHFSTAEYLTYAASHTIQYGFISTKAFRTPTKTIAYWSMFPMRMPVELRSGRSMVQLVEITPAALEMAAAASAWAKELPTTGSEYLMNLGVANRSPYVTFRQLGILASTVQAYMRHMDMLKPKETEPRLEEHYGKPGDKVVLELTVKTARPYVSELYGPKTVISMRDKDGREFVTFTAAWNPEPGSTHLVAATIKDHRDKEGKKSTVLARCRQPKQKRIKKPKEVAA